MSDTVKRAMDLVSKYQDPPSEKMKGFDWRPLKDVQESLGGLPEIPSHVEKFGSFMDETARRAATKGLEPRDLLKAYLITRSSIQRRAQDVDRIRASGLDLPKGMTGTIRPEGAMGEWLMSPMGQRYLNAAERGKVDEEAVAHAQQVMKPFGLSAESQALPWAAQNLPGRHKEVSELVSRALNGKSDPAEWRNFSKGLHGIGTAKAGFTASLLGRGDQPTLDARQVILQTGMPTSEAKKPMAKAGYEAVDRLAARQTALNPKMDSGLEPFRQHLTHHAIWDKAGNEETTHDDVVNALRNAKDGGRIEKSGGGSFGVGKFGDHVIDHAIRALGIPGHGLGDLHPDFIKALQQVSTPFSDDPAVVKKALAISQGLVPTMTKKKGASTSYYSYGQPMAPDEVKTTIGDIPGVKPLQQKQMSWEDFYKQGKGGTMINVGGDRSNLGRLTHINGKKLNWDVDLQAGPKYMLEPNPGAVWANSAGHTSSFNRIIGEAAKKGPVYGVYTPMGPESADQAHHMFDALMAQVDTGAISKADAKEFDDMLKAGVHMGTDPKDRAKGAAAMEGWPGILNPKEASEFAKTLPGIHRKAVVQKMDLANMEKKGFPSVGMTRAAITDPDLLKTPGNMMGHRIVQFDPERGPAEESAFKHLTYQEATPGQYVGDVPMVQRQYAMPDVTEKMTARTDWAKPGLIVHPYSDQPTGRSSVRKMFEEQKQTQPVNQRMLDSVMTGLERQKDYGFKAGGAVQPTDAQKQAGNYQKQHISFQGLPVAIENPKGSTRSGRDQDGKAWSVKMPYDYGYIKRTTGADGDHVDVCIGPDHTSDHVFLVDQHDHRTGKFDEHKVMLGYRTREEAVRAYQSGFSDGKGPDRMKNMVRLTIPEFKTWLKKHDTQKAVRGQGHIDRALSMTSMYTVPHDRDAG
jgi:hypothetical protein